MGSTSHRFDGFFKSEFRVNEAVGRSVSYVCDGKLLMDFHSFPLRIKEILDRPEEAELKVGHTDAIYGRSKGGGTPSGWRCATSAASLASPCPSAGRPADGRRKR